MSTYLERLANASVAELEAPAIRAVDAAVRRAHSAGIATVGTNEHGAIVTMMPSGEVLAGVTHPEKAPSPERAPSDPFAVVIRKLGHGATTFHSVVVEGKKRPTARKNLATKQLRYALIDPAMAARASNGLVRSQTGKFVLANSDLVERKPNKDKDASPARPRKDRGLGR